MTQHEVNQLEAEEIAAWTKYKAAVDESTRLLAIWTDCEQKWKIARRALQIEQIELSRGNKK